MSVKVGIDFGTSNSGVAVYDGQRVRLLPVDQKNVLPEVIKTRLLALPDRRISEDGVLILKAQRFRTQERNRQEALERVQALVDAALVDPVPRVPTRPTRASQRRRVDEKTSRGRIKALRGKVGEG